MRRCRVHLIILGSLLSLMWLLQIVDSFILQPAFSFSLVQYGISPRHLSGLRGIILAPFLHAGFIHLLSNTLPFLVLGWLVMLRGGVEEFADVSIMAALVGGLGTWVIGAPGMHVGASGVIFGYLGFLLTTGYFDRRLASLLFSIFVAVFYGSMLWGVLPLRQGVSWESHACGFLGGVLAARIAVPAREARVY